jgi:hypothetical protein
MGPLQSATLERLSLDDMIAKSTAIVRCKVTASWAAFSGPVIYTHYRVQVSERFKGQNSGTVEVLVPGGEANGLRQSFAGAPELKPGEDYVLFLFTGRTGTTMVIGLTQGLFSLAQETPADPLATRRATRELMLDPGTGSPVKDETMVMRLSQLRTRIAATLANGRTQAQ